jgi:hypothetical protein
VSALDRRIAGAVITGITVTAGLFHVLAQSQRPLWLDEACTYWTVHASVGQLLHGIRTDGTPPLYFVIVRAVTHTLGTSEFALRLPSILAAVLMVPAIFATTRRLAPERAAILAAALVAISPLVHFYAVEARPYALLQLETVAIVYALARGLEAPDRVGPWVGLAAGHAVQLATHGYGVFLLPAPTLVAFLTGKPRLKTTAKAAVAASAALVICGPWILRAASSAGSGVADWIAPFWQNTPPLWAIPRSLEVFGMGGQFPTYLAYVGDAPAFRVLTCLTTGGLLTLAVTQWPGRTPTTPRMGAWSLMLFLPLIGACLYSWLRVPLYLVGRYDTVVLPVCLMLIAVGLEALLRRFAATGWLTGAVLAGLAVASSLPALGFGHPVALAQMAEVSPAEFLAGAAQTDDLIVTTGLRRAVVAYYLDRAHHAADVRSFPAEISDHPGWYSASRMLRDRPRLVADAHDLSEALATAVQHGHTVWLLDSPTNDIDTLLGRQLGPHVRVDPSRTHREWRLFCLTAP